MQGIEPCLGPSWATSQLLLVGMAFWQLPNPHALNDALVVIEAIKPLVESPTFL